MFVIVERPIRLSSAFQRPRPAFTLALACSLTVVGAAATTLQASRTPDAPALIAAPAPTAVSTPTTSSSSSDTASVSENTTASVPEQDAAPTTLAAASESTTTTTLAPQPTVVAIFGDSVPAWLLRDAAGSFSRTDVTILNGAGEACDGMVELPLGRDRVGTELRPPDTCFDWTQTYPATLAQVPETDLGLLVLGQAPVIDRLIDGEWQGPCDQPAGAIDWYLDDVRARVEFLRDHAVEPVLVLPARYGQFAVFMVPDDHPERVQCVRDAMTRFAIDLEIRLIDFDPLLCVEDDCEARRTKDGVHVDPPFAPDVLDELLDLALNHLTGV